MCNVMYVSHMTRERCEGFAVLPPQTFYPIHYYHWEEYYNETATKVEVEKKLREFDEQNVIGAHVWNHFDYEKKVKVKKGSGQLYDHLARYSCPHIYKIAPSEF